MLKFKSLFEGHATSFEDYAYTAQKDRLKFVSEPAHDKKKKKKKKKKKND